MTTPQSFTFTELSEDEANLLVTGLAQLPYAKVYALINKLQQQALAQKQHAQPPNS
jgi:hypothetical protein